MHEGGTATERQKKRKREREGGEERNERIEAIGRTVWRSSILRVYRRWKQPVEAARRGNVVTAVTVSRFDGVHRPHQCESTVIPTMRVPRVFLLRLFPPAASLFAVSLSLAPPRPPERRAIDSRPLSSSSSIDPLFFASSFFPSGLFLLSSERLRYCRV